ncbi:hypothetical protein MGAST_27900 [Mycobacterium gastri 'Wayne']|nr:hypothetical protein MGAST_27900 [Mycobacterium gastri 'Wayne']
MATKPVFHCEVTANVAVAAPGVADPVVEVVVVGVVVVGVVVVVVGVVVVVVVVGVVVVVVGVVVGVVLGVDPVVQGSPLTRQFAGGEYAPVNAAWKPMLMDPPGAIVRL